VAVTSLDKPRAALARDARRHDHVVAEPAAEDQSFRLSRCSEIDVMTALRGIEHIMKAETGGPHLRRVSYCSLCLISPDGLSAGLHRLLVKARAHNAACDITGVLMFNQGCFTQTLEGPPETIKQLLARITADKRHGNVMISEDEPVARRRYERWSMALVADADLVSGLAGVMTEQVFGPNTLEDEPRLLSQIETFCSRLGAR
jgi:hypothetical protein